VSTGTKQEPASKSPSIEVHLLFKSIKKHDL
jgi:hypothetical protein